MEKPRRLKTAQEIKEYKARKSKLTTHTKDYVSEEGKDGFQIRYTNAEPNDAHWKL